MDAARPHGLSSGKDGAFAIRQASPSADRPKSPFSGLGKSPQGTPFTTPDVRLHHRAVLVPAGDDLSGTLGGLVRQLSIDQFENEGRRVSITPIDASRSTPLIDCSMPFAGIHKSVLASLLNPREWKPSSDRYVAPDALVALRSHFCAGGSSLTST